MRSGLAPPPAKAVRQSVAVPNPKFRVGPALHAALVVGHPPPRKARPIGGARADPWGSLAQQVVARAWSPLTLGCGSTHLGCSPSRLIQRELQEYLVLGPVARWPSAVGQPLEADPVGVCEVLLPGPGRPTREVLVC